MQSHTGIDARIAALEPHIAGGHHAGTPVDLLHDGNTIRYVVECKSAVDRKGHIDQVQRRLDGASHYGLLIAPYVSKELAEHCRTVGLQFIDTCGNAYLRAPGLFVLVTGEKNDRRYQAPHVPKGLTNAAGLRVVLALLTRRELVNAPLKDIARSAGVALGTAYNVLQDLAGRGYLINKENAGQRRLIDAVRLSEEWVINYPATLRTKLNGRRFSAPDPDWWKTFNLDEVEFAWGSEVAASKMTGYLKPGTQTMYVDPAGMGTLIRTLVKEYRLRPDPHGEIEILEKFWHWQPDSMLHIAPPLLVYSELLAIPDPRTRETANMIRERSIDPTVHQA